jgi:hypothetical protein
MESSINAVVVPVSFTLLFLLIIAFALLSALWVSVQRKRPSVKSLLELENSAHRVDLAAFRNLVDEDQEFFLRNELSAAEFRRIQRQRMRAAVEYVGKTAQNANAVLSLGEIVRLQSDPEAAEAGRRLLDCASTLRVNAMLSLIMLRVRILCPGMRLSLGQVIEGYERFSNAAQNLTRLQNPAYAKQVSAAI